MINPGGTNQEDNQLTSLEPCTLATPLQFDHDPGEVVLKASAAPTPTATPSGLPTTGSEPLSRPGLPWTTMALGILLAVASGVVMAGQRRRRAR